MLFVRFAHGVAVYVVLALLTRTVLGVRLQHHFPAPGAGVVLFPGLSPEHDSNLLHHLESNRSKELYYAQEGHGAHQAGSAHARVTSKFNEDIVVLEHSQHVSKVTCNGSDVQVCFTTPQAYTVAQNSWHGNSSRLILATYHQGCGNTVDGTRTFFLSNSSEFDNASMCATTSATQLTHEEAIHSMQVDFGTYKPVSSSNGTTGVRHREVKRQNVQTIDLNNNAPAFQEFYNIVVDLTEAQTGPDPDQPVNPDGTLNPQRRGIFSASISTLMTAAKAQAVASSIGNGFHDIVEKIKDAGTSFAGFVSDAYHHKFTVGFRNHIAVDVGRFDQTDAEVAKLDTALFGLGEGLALGDLGFAAKVQLISSGLKGAMQTTISFAYSAADGLQNGYVQFDLEPSQILLLFGIAVEGKLAHTFDKQVFAIPTPFNGVPNLFSVGPYITGTVALNLALELSAQILLGASVNLTAGTFKYNITGASTPDITGLEPSFLPIAKANGTLTGTADLGLPFAIEFGIDVLNGAFKQSAALVDHPSVYAAASVSTGSDCPGVETSLGIKNRIYAEFRSSTASNLPTYEFYTKGKNFDLPCLNLTGIGYAPIGALSGLQPAAFICPATMVCSNGQNVKRMYHERAINARQDDGSGADIPDEPDIAIAPLNVPTNIGNVTDKTYRILISPDDKAILVSGTDDFLYLVSAEQAENAVSAPFGTANLSASDDVPQGGIATDNVLLFDVFERLLNYDPARLNATGVSLVRATNASVMPTEARGISLVEIRTTTDSEGVYVFQPSYYDHPIAPVVCNIEGQDSKVLAVDVENTLLNFELPLDALELGLLNGYIGGAVQSCSILQLTSEDANYGLLV